MHPFTHFRDIDWVSFVCQILFYVLATQTPTCKTQRFWDVFKDLRSGQQVRFRQSSVGPEMVQEGPEIKRAWGQGGCFRHLGHTMQWFCVGVSGNLMGWWMWLQFKAMRSSSLPPQPRFTLLGSRKCSTEQKLSPKSQEKNLKTPGRRLFHYAVNVSGLIL